MAAKTENDRKIPINGDLAGRELRVRPTWLKPTAFLSLLLLLAPFFVLEFIYPRFPDSDHEISFKSPGRNMSQGGPFAAPELEGFLHFNPPIERIFFPHPPL